jgi:hypothetical protein
MYESEDVDERGSEENIEFQACIANEEKEGDIYPIYQSEMRTL